MYFKRKELEKFRSFKGPLIDVRSPSEYYKGHLPNSINIPLFDNDERSIIGTIYKKEGRKKAVIEGLNFFEKLSSTHLLYILYPPLSVIGFNLYFTNSQAMLCERIPPLEQYILIKNSLFLLGIVL